MSLHFAKAKAKVGFGTEKTEKYVGKRRFADPFDLQRLAKEVSHVTGQQQAQVEITLNYMIQAIEDALLDGRSVALGSLGTLSPAISTIASDTADGVKIRRKRVLFRASKQLRTIIQNLSVRLITDEDDGTTDTADDSSSPTGGGQEGASGNSGTSGSGSGNSGTGGNQPENSDSSDGEGVGA